MTTVGRHHVTRFDADDLHVPSAFAGHGGGTAASRTSMYIADGVEYTLDVGDVAFARFLTEQLGRGG